MINFINRIKTNNNISTITLIIALRVHFNGDEFERVFRVICDEFKTPSLVK